MKDISNKIICGDVTKVLRKLPPDSIDCVVTSPPYWALRDYEIEGQLGLEKNLHEYINKMLQVTSELKRVLKKTGTMWWNHGDSYGGKMSFTAETKSNAPCNQGRWQPINPIKREGTSEKCLMMQPYRLAQRMIDEQGWILRNVIIWYKPNCMPSSVKDRFTVDFECIFFFVKNKKYWFETQYDPLKDSSIDRLKHNFNRNKGDIQSAVKTSGIKKFQERFLKNQVQGRNKRCVWTITTKGFKGAHFAVFPPQLVETPIKAGCPEFVCKRCGKAKEKIWNIKYEPYKTGAKSQVKTKCNETGNLIQGATRPQQMKYGRANKIVIPTGYTDCGCNAGFKPGIVLDPFSGSGTTLAVAKSLGRDYIGIDLNPEYIKMAQRRIDKLNETNTT